MDTETTEAPEVTEAPEQTPEPEAPEEPKATEGETKEADAEAPDEAPAAETETPETKHRRSGGYQRKIERLEREREILLQQLQRSGQQPQTAAPTQPAKEKTPGEKAADYFDELLDQREAAREARRQAEAQATEFKRQGDEARAVHPDFDDVVVGVDIHPASPLGQALLTSKAGAEIMYQLAKSPAELARIRALSPLQVAREVFLLEAKSASGATPQTSPKPAPRKQTAPAPIAPVTPRGPSSSKRPEDMSYDEYSAWRSSQRKR